VQVRVAREAAVDAEAVGRADDVAAVERPDAQVGERRLTRERSSSRPMSSTSSHSRFLFVRPFSYARPSSRQVAVDVLAVVAFASRRSWHSVCAPWHVEQMFIISAALSTCCASANVRALSVSASSWLCSAITPAPQHEARSSSTSSRSSSGAICAMAPCNSGVKPRLTQPGQ
jgi:hypothetical protein